MKITHTIAGAAIAAALLPWGVIPDVLAVVVTGAGKEVWDAQGHGTPDHIDALVTVAGGAAMLGWLLFALSCTPSRKRSQERYLALVFTVSVLALA